MMLIEILIFFKMSKLIQIKICKDFYTLNAIIPDLAMLYNSKLRQNSITIATKTNRLLKYEAKHQYP